MCRDLECNYPPARVPQVRVCSQCRFTGECWLVGRNEPWCLRCIAYVVTRVGLTEERK